jgi:hypothetical protein
MPLIKSKSPKAFSKNVEIEMNTGKPQKQALAIAYSVKRKAKKASGGTVKSGSKDMNMAEGGQISISAKDEKRPMPDNTYGDSSQTQFNKNKKAPSQDSWTSSVTVKQAQKPSLTKLSQPKIVGSDAFSVRNRDMDEDEKDLMAKIPPQTDKAQPDVRDNEEDAKKMGKSPDMSKSHTSSKAYAKGGKINNFESMDEAEEDKEPSISPLDGLDDEETPAVDEFMSKNMAPMLAKGGHIDEMEDNYADDGDEDSIAAAVMARRNRMHDEINSGSYDLDSAVSHADGGILKHRNRMHDEIDSGSYDEDLAASHADGGILSHDSIYSDDSDQADLSRNADEDANEEDQLSFNALRKENYSETEGLDDLGDQPHDSNLKGDDKEDSEHDKHDMVESIRKKMKSKRQF